MAQLPFRKFVHIPSSHDLEVGSLARTPADESSYHHIDLIRTIHERKTGIPVDGWPKNLPDEIILGWLVGDSNVLTVEVLNTETAHDGHKTGVMKALEDWANGRFKLIQAGEPR